MTFRMATTSVPRSEVAGHGVTVVSATKATRLGPYLRELWAHRSLVRVLAGRELKGAHEMNLVGFVWWLMEPLTFAAVYFIIVDVIFNRGEPSFPLFVLISLLPYKWLVQSVTGAMGTVRDNQSLVANLYFPRALLPVADVAVGLAHFLVGLLVIPIFMAAFTVGPTIHLIWLPVVVAVQIVFTIGLALPAAAIGVNYRNLPKLTANLLRMWFYLSPGIWALSRITDDTLLLVAKLNPLTGLFESYRGAILTPHAPGWELLVTLAVGLVGCVAGGWYFVRREATFGKVLL